MGERARTAARGARGAARRGRRGRGRQSLGAARGRAARDRRDRLPRRLGAERRLARRRARRHGRAGDPAHDRGGGHAALHGDARRLGGRGGRALRAQPARLLRRRGHARSRTRCATCATRTACGSRMRSRRTASSSIARGRRAAACEDVRAYLELHIEQGPVLEGLGLPVGTVLGTVGVERNRVIFRGQAAHAGSTPMTHRRDSFLAAARFALAVRDAAVRHGGDDDHGRRDFAARRGHGDRGRDGLAARPAAPRRGHAGGIAGRVAGARRRGGRGRALHRRVGADLAHRADPVRPRPDRRGARGLPGGRRQRSHAAVRPAARRCRDGAPRARRS